MPAGAAQDAAANGNIASSEYTVTVDTIIPSVTITAPTTATGAFSVTITFSENMTEFDSVATDIMLSGRAAATVTSLTGSGTTYTANIAPTSNGNLNISVPKNVAKDKANNGNTASQTRTVSISLTGPSVAIQGVPTDPQNSAFTVTITFSETVTGFTAEDILLGTDVDATVTSLTGSGMTYTATITPADEFEEQITLSVPASAAQDDANMDNTASSEYSIQLDTVQPSVTITAPATAAKAFDVTIMFTENVTGFAQTDISLTDSTATAALTNFTIENAKKYTAVITPTTDGDVVISIPAGVAKDAAENQNTAADTSTVTVEFNNAPAFNTGINITPTIAENTAADTNIGTPLTATDADTTDTLTYRLKAHADDADDYLSFVIDENTGQLKTKANVDLDFETQSTYKVTVEVSDSIATATIDVTITITDENEAPTFPAATDTRSVTENTAAAENIGAVITATDPDSGDTLSYSIDDTADAVFDIDSTSGQLKTEAALDYESATSHTVIVTATDSGNLTDTITVTINITNVNEAPTFPATTDTTLEIAENTPAGENIGDAVAATDPDVTSTNMDANPATSNPDVLVYSLVDADDPDSDAAEFAIDDETGQLETKASLDYETKASYTVMVKVSDGTLTDTITATITIIDVDETKPTVRIDAASEVKNNPQNGAFDVTITFSETVTGFTANDISLTTTLTEGTGNGTATLKNASDGDTVYTAEITPPADAEGNVDIQVLAAVAQDAASLDNAISNKLTVAIDTKSPTVSITDVPSTTQNDAFNITITFSETVTNFVQGDISLTDSTATATATDFTAVSGTEYTVEITPTTNGDVKIKVPADVAEDAAGNGNTESQLQSVAVILPAPTVEITAVPTTPTNSAFDITIEFSETVTGFEVSDISLGENVSATVSLTAVQGSDTQYTATIMPAADVAEEIVISVPAGAAQNAANTDNIASAEHRVQLDTVKPRPTLMGPSGTQTGAFSITITFRETVTDFLQGDISLADSTATATVTDFTAVSGTEYTVEITPTTNGDVKIKVPTDAAQDAANNGNTESDTLTVAVTISSDPVDPVNPFTNNKVNPPEPIMLASQNNVLQPDQTVTPGTFELIMDFGEPVTGFQQSELGIRDFRTDVTIIGWHEDAEGKKYTATLNASNTGSVTFTVPEDAVTAIDNGVGNNETKLSVFVQDDAIELNRAPVFATDAITRTIAENAEIGTAIGAPVTATDPDNDRLTYRLEAHDDAPNDYKAFFIGYRTGQLSTSAALDHETQSTYKLTVKVADDRDGIDTIAVTINVTDVAETPLNWAPVFATDSTTREIAENTASNQPIGTKVTATDPDGDPLIYSLKAHSDAPNDSNAFSIESTATGGQLKTKAALDYETQSAYKVIVEVSDSEMGTDTITVTINITDVAETPLNRAPVFAMDSTTREIAENTASNQPIGTKVTATDPDNDPLTYSLKAHSDAPNDSNAFSIESTATGGQLKTKAALDYETQSAYKVIVEVSDSEMGTDTITVTINVTDVDEALPNRPPIFASENTIRSIAETTIADVKIGKPVSATDPDGDPLIYSLEGTDAASFKIVESTGQLKTEVGLDREIKSQYTVTVKVDDGNGGTDTIAVTINILTPDRPEPIMFVKQDGVVKQDQTVTPGTFALVMDFAQPVTGFEKSELGIDAFHTTVTITGWQVSNDGSDYIATVYVEKNGSVTFTVPENALQAVDDGQTNEEWKLFVMVMDNAAPTGRKDASRPTETVLLPNYPNPFNPETWMPYHLASASEVQITIYDARGSVVRTLDLGHRAAGRYTSRSRAAYWNAANDFGESVASGVYFYTLTTGDFSATRKMLIRK